MRQSDFYDLPRPVQDRFIGCVRGEGQPQALLEVGAEMPRDLPVFASLVAAGMVGLVLLLRWGFGELGSRLAIQPLLLIAAYALVLAAMLGGALRFAQRLRETTALPFRAGVYLFPIGIVDARTHKLRVFSLTTLVESSPEDRALRLTFADGTEFALPVQNRSQSEQAHEALGKAREALTDAMASEDVRNLGLLDPLQDIGVANPFAPKTSIAPKMPMWARGAWFAAALGGLVLAPAVWRVRNGLSDGAMLSRANRAANASAYRDYLASGGRDKEVRPVLLPRAELADAVRQGSVEAIEKYMAGHPDSPIAGEVTAALRQAMLAELDVLKRSGAVSALAAFAKRHPYNVVDAELRDALHVAYQGAFSTYKRASGVKDAAALAFVQDLLSFAEKSGPRVVLRFRRRPAHSMEVADTRIQKNRRFTGPGSLPSQYFDDAHSRPREAAAAEVLINRFAAAFPADVLSFEVAPPSEADGAAVDVPAMWIDHSAEASGALYFRPKPRGILVGVGLTFEATWLIPGSAKPFQFRTALWRPPRLRVAKDATEPFEAGLYEAMAESGFAHFTQKFLAVFFPNPEPATSN